MGMAILYPGPMTTIQDEGRYGYQRVGITTSGAMDVDSMHLANELVGNPPQMAVLEMTMIGPMFQMTSDAVIGIAGADMGATCNGKPLEINTSVYVGKGDQIQFAFAKNGCRGYLAVQGGFDVEPELGSCSTNVKCQLGGYKARPLKAGDRLDFAMEHKELSSQVSWDDSVCKSVAYIPYNNTVALQVILGPQQEYFTSKGIETFLNETYRVTENADRMGYKLDGARIEAKDGVDIVSDGIVFGSIQVPPNGKPIIMMADHQTTGGYAKIATVITKDLGKLAQAKPGDGVRFTEYE